MKKNQNCFYSALFILCAGLVCACNNAPRPPSHSEQVAADSYRYPQSEGVVSDEQTVEKIGIELSSAYPVWRANMTAAVEARFTNPTKAFMYARVVPRLYIYDPRDKRPLFWSEVDLAYADTAGPGTVSVFSLPPGASKTVVIPVRALKFARAQDSVMSEYEIYDMVPTGAYLMRLEADFYTEKDKKVGGRLSNFIEFTTVFNDPEVVRTNEPQKP